MLNQLKSRKLLLGSVLYSFIMLPCDYKEESGNPVYFFLFLFTFFIIDINPNKKSKQLFFINFCLLVFIYVFKKEINGLPEVAFNLFGVFSVFISLSYFFYVIKNISEISKVNFVLVLFIIFFLPLTYFFFYKKIYKPLAQGE